MSYRKYLSLNLPFFCVFKSVNWVNLYRQIKCYWYKIKYDITCQIYMKSISICRKANNIGNSLIIKLWWKYAKRCFLILSINNYIIKNSCLKGRFIMCIHVINGEMFFSVHFLIKINIEIWSTEKQIFPNIVNNFQWMFNGSGWFY